MQPLQCQAIFDVAGVGQVWAPCPIGGCRNSESGRVVRGSRVEGVGLRVYVGRQSNTWGCSKGPYEAGTMEKTLL